MKKSTKFIKLCEKYGVNPDNIPEITSFDGACKDQGLDPSLLPIVDHLPDRNKRRLVSDYKLSVIAHSLCEKKDADYTNDSVKYFPVFVVKANKKRPSGFGLSYHVCDYRVTGSDVGVRLCFPNRDIAEFFGKHFMELHVDHHLLT